MAIKNYPTLILTWHESRVIYHKRCAEKPNSKKATHYKHSSLHYWLIGSSHQFQIYLFFTTLRFLQILLQTQTFICYMSILLCTNFGILLHNISLTSSFFCFFPLLQSVKEFIKHMEVICR